VTAHLRAARELRRENVAAILLAMAIAHIVEAQRLRSEFGLTDSLLARATGAAPSTVREWLRSRSAPTGVRAERVGELAETADRLSRVIRPDYIAVWLTKPIEALDDDKPIDVIAAGGYRRVMRIVSALEDTGAV
jgi:transcriptional regulator with XRE-family HTH domain